MIAARLSPGAISESSSSHLPPRGACKKEKPVVFPLGRSSRGKMLLESATPAKTIGIVCVSRWRAAVAPALAVVNLARIEVVRKWDYRHFGAQCLLVAHLCRLSQTHEVAGYLGCRGR